MVYLVLNGPGSAETREKSFDELFPYFEFTGARNVNGFENAKKLSDPRPLKSHLAAKFFHRQLDEGATCPRLIVVLRNPMDLLVSFYHFHHVYVS